MKNKKLITSAAFMAMCALISSCSGEESTANIGDDLTAFSAGIVTETPITRVSFDSSESPIEDFGLFTRTSMDCTEIGGRGTFLWEPGDFVYIEDDSGKLFKSQNSVTETQSRCTFFVRGSYSAKASYNV